MHPNDVVDDAQPDQWDDPQPEELRPKRKISPRPWWWLLPIVPVFLALKWLGMSNWIFLGLLIGIAGGIFLGRKMEVRNPKYVLCINIETMTVRVIMAGRKGWAKVTRIGCPWLTLTTPTGWELEVARSYDAETMTLEYPEDAEYSDAVIAAMPGKYRQMISELVELRRQLSQETMERDLAAQQEAARMVQQFEQLFRDTVMPPKAESKESKT